MLYYKCYFIVSIVYNNEMQFCFQHDNKGDCYHFGTSDPNSEEGNYLMYESATQGNLPNNVKFSNCSSEKIAFFIDNVVNERNGKVDCFTGKCISFDIYVN